MNFATNIEGVRIKHAMLRKPQTFNYNIDLLDLFDDTSGSVALIVDDENKLVQIITDYDTADYFRQRAQDIILVENIENTLKDFVQLAFGSDSDGEARLDYMIQKMSDASFIIRQKFEKGLRHYLGSKRLKLDDDLFDQVFENKLFEEGLRSYLNSLPDDENALFDDVLFEQVFEKHFIEKKPPPKFDDLTLGNFIDLFLHKDYWPYHAEIFELEKSALNNLLENVRKTRNDLSHFREISPDQSVQLRDCYDLLNDHQGAVARAFSQDDFEAGDVITPDEGENQDSDPTQPIEDEVAPGDSRYAPLAIWLQSQPPDKNLIKPNFAKIEEIIGGKLPDSAYKNRSWWANDTVGHVQSKQWLDVGWRVATASMVNQVVRFVRIKDRENAYIRFFSGLINDSDFNEEQIFQDINRLPDGHSWHWLRNVYVGKQQLASFNYSFGRGRIFRVELYIDSGDKEINKQLFDKLFDQQNEIESAVDHELNWQRLNTKRASRIAYIFKGHITDSDVELAQLQQKAPSAMVRFAKELEPRVKAIGKEIL